MYLFEILMKILKGYVQNRNRPNGCIVKSYVAKEAIDFCLEYISNAEVIGIFKSSKIGKVDVKSLSRGHPTPIEIND